MVDIYHNLIIKATAEKVYDIFSQPDHLDNWWTLESSGKPTTGNEYRMYFGPSFDWRFAVNKAQRGKAFEWKVKSADDDWVNTTVGIRLEDSEDGTRVNFYHTGWPDSNDHFKHSNFCWALLLNGMKRYIEDNIIIPFESRA